jgi:hypothetical protein
MKKVACPPFSLTHDKCYGTCGKSKAECDSNLLKDAKNVCNGLSGYWYYDCMAAAFTYYGAVAALGDLSYYLAQKKNCCKK